MASASTIDMLSRSEGLRLRLSFMIFLIFWAPLASSAPPGLEREMDAALISILLLVPAYFLPMLVAVARNHRYANVIALLNMVLGWTLLGWVVALLWAATNPQATHPRLARWLHLIGMDPPG